MVGGMGGPLPPERTCRAWCLRGIQWRAVLSRPRSDRAGVVSHRRGTRTPRQGPEGRSLLGAKAEPSGRAADILKNVRGFHVLSTWEPAACGKRTA